MPSTRVAKWVVAAPRLAGRLLPVVTAPRSQEVPAVIATPKNYLFSILRNGMFYLAVVQGEVRDRRAGVGAAHELTPAARRCRLCTCWSF